MKHRRIRDETECDDLEETRNTTFVKRSYNLLEWIDNLEIGSPNLLIPPQIANYVGSSPFCRFAVSPRLDRIAVMNFNRELNVYILDGNRLPRESSVQVLEEEFPEYCLLQYSECGNLLLSSRSSAEIDVFDSSGGYCYAIPLETTTLNIDLRSAISCMSTFKNVPTFSDDKYLNWLYVLQYNGTFSAFKIGRLSRYCPMWSCQLGIGLVNNFILLKEYNLLLVGAHYPIKGVTQPAGGLCSFRLIDGEPYIDPIRTLQHNTGWLSYLPFSSSQYAFISSMSLSFSTPHKLVCTSTSGDIFIYDLPSTSLITVIRHTTGPRPVQSCFVDEMQIATVLSDGSLIRSELENFEEALAGNNTEHKFDGRAAMAAPKLRELFILIEKMESGAHREVVSERTFLAARIWLYTIWSTLKSLIGMAVGDSPVPLHMVKHSDSFSFVLHYLPTRSVQQLLDRTLSDKDYKEAKKLAADYDSININTILKCEWNDINMSDAVSIDAVHNILKNISDNEWVAEACLTCLSTNLDAQRAIAALGFSLESLPAEITVRLFHNVRILAACTDISFYLLHRSKSLLSVAQEFSKSGDIACLQKLLEQNWATLKPYILYILSYLPPVLAPSKYSIFLPNVDGDFTGVSQEVNNSFSKFEATLLNEHNTLLELVNFEGNEGAIKDENYLLWVRKRAMVMENETGLYNNSVELLKISLENGYKQLDEDIMKWNYFISYVKMCSAVSETFSGFWSLPVEVIVSKVSKIPADQAVLQAEEILSLVEFLVVNSNDSRKHVQTLLLCSCEHSTDVLKKFKELRPRIVDKELITQCMCHSSLTGKRLLDEMRALGVYAELCSALRALLDLGVKPTFQKLLESETDGTIARSFIMQAIANMRIKSPEEWETLKDDVLHLSDSIYSKLIPRVEVVELMAKELLLNDMLRTNTDMLKTLLTLDKNGPKEFDGVKLGQIKTAEVLLKLSVEIMNNVVGKDDVNLDKSRFFATLAKPISPRSALEQLKFLDAIDIIYELGSVIMPATVRLYDPMQILQEIIQIKNNYKKGKTLAKLATLLEISTPVSTALSLASLVAIERNDEECLSKYIAEIIKARDVLIVHQLCVQIIKSSYKLPALDDIYACALLNCPNDDIANTLKLIDENRKKWKTPVSIIPTVASGLVIDPIYSTVKSCTKYSKNEPLTDDNQLALSNLSADTIPSEAARAWARESSSVALSFAIMRSDEHLEAWTNNETLLRYEQALRHFATKMCPFLVENIPPKLLIANYNKTQGNETPLDRIEMQGVDRERFISDIIYRTESLDGLAMTDDDLLFTDAIALANHFHVDEWRLHMASLENALTTCPLNDAKRILKARGHLNKLRTAADKFHSALRSNVLPLINTNELFVAYLSLFLEDQPEKAASPTLKKILERKKDLKAKKLFMDPKYLTDVIISMPDKFIISVADGIRKYPVGVEACEKAARILTNGTDIRPPSSIIALYALLGEDESTIIDLIASKPLDEEIRYLDNALIIMEATPNAPESLLKILTDRLNLLKSPVTTSPTPEPVEPSFVLTSRRRQ